MASKEKKTSTYRHSDIVASVTAVALFKVDGVASLSSQSGIAITGQQYTSKNRKSIQVYVVGDKVIIDIFLNVKYGYSLTDLAYNIQESIKREVPKATHFTVEKVNVNVVGVVFPS